MQSIAEGLAGSGAFRSKCAIARIARCIDPAPRAVAGWRELDRLILIGDDTAAIPESDGYLLFAAEGLLPAFVDRDPYFAGWCSVMVNVSDVAAMGGHPLAVVDVCFHATSSPVERVLLGLQDACRAYGVPLVGGHTTCLDGNSGGQVLVVAIVGRSERLMTSFGALPGDIVLFGVDLGGSYRPGFDFWNATEGRSAESLRADLGALEALAAAGVVDACKDVSNAGIAGTLLMMLEASGVGGVLDLDRLPRPEGVDLERWLRSFPSYGFLFAVRPDQARVVQRALQERALSCEAVGRIDASRRLRLAARGEEATLWDLAERPFAGFARPEAT